MVPTSHRPRRHLLACLVSLAVALTSMVGCIDFPTLEAQPEVELHIGVPDALQAGYLTEQIRAFERDNPTIKVTIFSKMSAFRGGLAQAIQSLTATSQALDVVYLTDPDFRSLSNSEVLTDLSPFIRESGDLLPSAFYANSLPVFQSRGRQMVLPTEIVPMMIFYNRDLFDKMGVAYPSPTWTTADFQSTTKSFVGRSGPTGEVAGFVSDPMTSIWPFLLVQGADFPDVERDPSAKSITAPETVRGLQWFADLSLRDKVTPVPPNSRQLGLWYTGKAATAALFMSNRNVVPQQGGRNDATPTPGPRQAWGFRWDVVPMPRGTRQATVVYVAGYGIPNGTKYPNEAWMLIRYLAQSLPPQGGGSSYVPAVKSLARSAEFASLYAESGRRAYVDSVEWGQPLPSFPPGVQITDQDISPVLLGDTSADQALQRLRERIGPAFERAAQSQQ